jgi:hypothetical protein
MPLVFTRIDLKTPEIKLEQNTGEKPELFSSDTGLPTIGLSNRKEILQLSATWRFSDPLCATVDPSFNSIITILTATMSKIVNHQDGAGIKQRVYNTNEAAKELVDANWIYVDDLEGFAPEQVDEFSKAILHGDENFVDSVLEDKLAYQETIIVKDRTWLLINSYQQEYNRMASILGINLYELLLADKKLFQPNLDDEYKLSPFMLSVLTRQNNIALKLLDKTEVKLEAIEIKGFNFFEILWLIGSRLVTDLQDKYALEACKAYFSILSKLPENHNRISLYTTNRLHDVMECLTVEQMQALYTQCTLDDYLLSRREIIHALAAIYKSGVDINHVHNDYAKSHIGRAINEEQYVLFGFLLDNGLDLSVSIGDTVPLQKINESFIAGMPSADLLTKFLQNPQVVAANPIAADSTILHATFLAVGKRAFTRAQVLCIQCPHLIDVKDEHGRLPVQLFCPYLREGIEIAEEEVAANCWLQDKFKEHYGILYKWLYFSNVKQVLNKSDNRQLLKELIVKHNVKEYFAMEYSEIFKMLFAEDLEASIFEPREVLKYSHTGALPTTEDATKLLDRQYETEFERKFRENQARIAASKAC